MSVGSQSTFMRLMAAKPCFFQGRAKGQGISTADTQQAVITFCLKALSCEQNTVRIETLWDIVDLE